MKIIDLLNKIANGEEVPKKIRIYGRNDSIYEWQPINNANLYHYFNIDTHARMGSDWKLDGRILNNEVEILEEEKKIPEKLKWNEKSQHNIVTDNTKKTLEHLLSRSEQLKKSINEIIDYLKSKGE